MRVNEREQQRLASELIEADLLAVLVDQDEIRNLLAGLGNVQRRSTVDGAVADFAEADVFEFSVLAENQRCMNLIAGRDCLEDPRVIAADDEWHGHALH